jgi:hypothetical protein
MLQARHTCEQATTWVALDEVGNVVDAVAVGDPHLRPFRHPVVLRHLLQRVRRQRSWCTLGLRHAGCAHGRGRRGEAACHGETTPAGGLLMVEKGSGGSSGGWMQPAGSACRLGPKLLRRPACKGGKHSHRGRGWCPPCLCSAACQSRRGPDKCKPTAPFQEFTGVH